MIDDVAVFSDIFTLLFIVIHSAANGSLSVNQIKPGVTSARRPSKTI